MRQHSENFVICLSKKLPLQNCAAPEKCGYFLKMRKESEGILCVFQDFFPKYWGNTRLFRQFITMARRPTVRDFSYFFLVSNTAIKTVEAITRTEPIQVPMPILAIPAEKITRTTLVSGSIVLRMEDR